MTNMEGAAGMWTTQQAAAFLGRSPHTLESWRSRGENTELEYTKWGRSVLYDPDSVRRFFRDRCQRRRSTLPEDCPRYNTTR